MQTVVDHKKVWLLAWPVILSNISIPMLEATNTSIMGHLSDPVYIGALALAITLVQYIYICFNFLRMGTTGMTAQAFGSKDSVEIANSFFRPVMIALLVGVLIAVLQYPVSVIAFKIFQGSESVEYLANEYFRIRICGAAFTLGNYVMIGWLLGIQKPKITLLLQVFMNVLNIFLVVLFVLSFGFGIKGAALATLISETVTFFIGLFFVLNIINKNYKLTKDQFMNAFKGKAKFLEIFQVNGNIFIRSMLLITAFAWFTNSGAKQGELVLAANELLLLMLLFLSYALDGFAQAAEMLVGETVGAKDLSGFKKSIKLSTVWAFAFAVIFSVTYLFGGKLIIELLTDIQSVREMAYMFLPWMICMPLIGIWSYQLDGIFIGATQTKDMRNMMIIAFIVYAIAISTLIPLYGNNGLWMSLMIFLLARSAGLYLRLPVIVKRFS